MTLRRADNRIPSAESYSFVADRFPARSAHQAKAKPSLRTDAGGVGELVAVAVDGEYYFPGYDNNGNVIGYWNEDGERGHAEVFFEWAVPRLISKLEPYCTNGKRYKTEGEKRFARASIGLDAQIILHTPVYLTESNKRADKLAAEKLYLLPSYGFVE